MKIIVVGLGVQGKKRAAIAGKDFIAAVDPVNPDAHYQQLEQVPLTSYDAAIVCTGDKPKVALLKYLLTHHKHVLVEKPLYASAAEINELQQLANKNNLTCYTAYNHRFEPHLIRVRDILQQQTLGEIYHCRLFYGNGTARQVKESAWRDQGSGVLHDLGSHLLDLIDYLFGSRSSSFKLVNTQCFENNAPDHVTFIDTANQPNIECQMTLLSWRNDFSCDILAEKGSVHVRSLCKWGPAEFTLRTRVLPSGRPPEESSTLIQEDPTWKLEYEHFKQLIISGKSVDLTKDIWISQQLNQLHPSLIKESVPC